VLLVKLIVTQLIEKFPASYGTQKFITMFTRLRHYPSPKSDESSSRLFTLFSKDHSNTLLPSTSRSSKWFLHSDFSTKLLYAFIIFLMHATCPAPDICLFWRVQIMKLLVIHFPIILLLPAYSLRHFILIRFQSVFSTSGERQNFTPIVIKILLRKFHL